VPAAAEVAKPGARGRGATTRCLAPSRSFSPGAARPTATRPGVLSCNWLLANCDRALPAAGLDRSLYRPQLDFSWITLCRARGCIVLLARVPTLHADEGQAGGGRPVAIAGAAKAAKTAALVRWASETCCSLGRCFAYVPPDVLPTRVRTWPTTRTTNIIVVSTLNPVFMRCDDFCAAIHTVFSAVF
jgi:hypothetical protein